MLSIEAGEHKNCTQIRITNDRIPEIPKHFAVTVSTDEFHPEAILDPGRATVTILDDDRKL